ncbi:hypothetical protein HanIR_Chr15g0741821 [Helianthus annuus]|nr:hypothetical protein HanIR_Chr15g0741821 [Helianthus annuus]
MTEPSNPHNVEGENPDHSSPAAAEEEEEGGAPGGGLPVLKWPKSTFDRLMTEVQMPQEYGAIYPQEGDTGADAPAGYVTMWADFFGDCNLWLPLTVFVVEVLEWYKIHISQLSPFGMIRIRNFEYTFRALGMEPTVGDFRWFYQMTVSLGFFSFHQRDGSPKLMTPPKGITKCKTKFFYIKAAAVTATLTFRNVTETIISESLAVPRADTVDLFPQMRTIEWKTLNNTQLWVLRMMLTRMNRKARPVVREKSGGKYFFSCADAALWRIFDPDFEGKVVTVACTDDEDGFNVIIRDNFRVPTEAALTVELPQGKGDLGALGDPDVKGVPKKQVVKGMRFRQKKKPEAAVVPPLVSQRAGISPTCFRRYTDYVVVSDTLEGLGVPVGGAAAGGSSTGSKPADEKKKRKAEEKAAGAG